MALVGNIRVGTVGSAALQPNAIYFIADQTLLVAQAFASWGINVDGIGAGTALLRGVIYNDSGALVQVGDEIAVPGSSPDAWVTLPPPDLSNVTLAAGGYRLGVWVGGNPNAVAVSEVANVVGGLLDGGTPTSTYTTTVDGGTPSSTPVDVIDGGTPYSGEYGTTGTVVGVAAAYSSTGNPPSVLAAMPATDIALYGTTFDPWSAPANVDDMYNGRLPWELSQRVLSLGSVPRNLPPTVQAATCGWHGVNFDQETGAFAIARNGGLAEDLVGERVLVVRRHGVYVRFVAVYCYSQRNFPVEVHDEDISLTRRAYIELASWADDTATVDLTILPAVAPAVPALAIAAPSGGGVPTGGGGLPGPVGPPVVIGSGGIPAPVAPPAVV